MATLSKYSSPEIKKLLTMISKTRGNKSTDLRYHSGRKKKEYASPSLEFVAKLTRNARRVS